jgi:hypothetical protein
MSRLPRLVMNNEQASQVPADQAVTFRLSPESVPEVSAPTSADLGSPPPASERHYIQPSRSDSPDLHDQIEALRQNERALQQRAANAEAQVQAAQNWYTQQQMWGQLGATKNELEQGMQSASAELEAAKANYSVALSRGDHNAAAHHMAEMTAAQQRMQIIQDGQYELGEYVQRMQQQAQQPRQQAPQLNAQNVHQWIDSQMPALTDKERKFLHDNPDAILDPANQTRLHVGFVDSQQRGIRRDSDEYFRFLRGRLNYEAEDNSRGDPVSQVLEASSGESRPQRRSKHREVTLTPDEVRFANQMGLSLEDYGRNKLKLQEYKRRGMYQES